LEKNVTLRVRETDVSEVEGLLEEVAADYKAASNKEVNLKLDTDSFLAPQTCGGIELLAQKNKIKICNTLESRLELIAQQLVPAVRTALFGRNPNRKFAE
jgi:V-type H+-transporting ATPase subunit E